MIQNLEMGDDGSSELEVELSAQEQMEGENILA